MEEFEIKDGVLVRYHEIDGKTTVIVPQDVTKIGHGAFINCTNLTNIILPESITEIGFSAFQGCTNLKSITLPKSLTYIYDMAFSGCKNLTEIVLPENIIQIGDDVFRGCTNLKSISLPTNITSIGTNSLMECPNLINFNASEQVFGSLIFKSQYSIVSNFAKQYNNDNTYTEDDISRYKKFILFLKKNLMFMLETYKKMYLQNEVMLLSILEKFKKDVFIPIIKNKPLLYFVCNSMDDVFTSSELEKLIDLSAKIGETETTAFLMDYKQEHFGHENYLDSLNLDFNLDDDNRTK